MHNDSGRLLHVLIINMFKSHLRLFRFRLNSKEIIIHVLISGSEDINKKRLYILIRALPQKILPNNSYSLFEDASGQAAFLVSNAYLHQSLCKMFMWRRAQNFEKRVILLLIRPLQEKKTCFLSLSFKRSKVGLGQC